MSEQSPWYRGVTGYQWLVLFLASAGWVFDVYEGQVYSVTRGQMLGEILEAPPGASAIKYYGDLFLGVFLVGGAVGGIGFGVLADRWGRRPVLVLTILTYSVFSGLTYFATELWHVAALRFLVALGVGGEWSVAASLVAEVFQGRSRTFAGAIFHASSVIGTWLAGLAAMAVGSHWRYAYLLGVLPAILVVAIRAGVSEPQASKLTSASASIRELLVDAKWRNRALLGFALAAIGLGTFWGVTIAGQDLTEQLLRRTGADASDASTKAKFAFSIVQTAGGGLGLLAFGPLADRFGRRRAFVGMQLAALIVVPLVCYVPTRYCTC